MQKPGRLFMAGCSSERVAIGLAVEAELKAQGERRGRPKTAGEDIPQNFAQFEAGQNQRNLPNY